VKISLSIIGILLYQITSAQISVKENFIMAKEWSKEIALYRAKSFVIKNILGTSNEIIKVEIAALAAANSGELTSLVYKCDAKDKEGLVLAFFGTYWNDAGVIFTGYDFKDVPKAKAVSLLDKIAKAIDENYKYLEVYDNNVYFQDDDMTFLIYHLGYFSTKTKVRVFWNGFDAEWDTKSFYATREELQEKLIK